MSLKDAYYENSTGFLAKTAAARDAGVALVGTQAGEGQYNTIVAGLEDAAAKGLVKFQVRVPVTFNPTALRGNNGDNLIFKSFASGVVQALSSQNIYSNEVSVVLNLSDTVNTYLDLNFTF